MAYALPRTAAAHTVMNDFSKHGTTLTTRNMRVCGNGEKPRGTVNMTRNTLNGELEAEFEGLE